MNTDARYSHVDVKIFDLGSYRLGPGTGIGRLRQYRQGRGCETCIGQLPAAIDGLNPSANPGRLAKAQMPLHKGGVCTAAAYAVAAPAAVFRVYDGTRPSSAYGGWWSLTRPTGSRDDYRAQNAICNAWSALDRLIVCRLKPHCITHDSPSHLRRA